MANSKNELKRINLQAPQLHMKSEQDAIEGGLGCWAENSGRNCTTNGNKVAFLKTSINTHIKPGAIEAAELRHKMNYS